MKLARILPLAVAACAHLEPYMEPTVEEPHALLKVRVAYHAAPGPTLVEALTLDGRALPTPPPAAPAGRQYTRAVRVRPVAQHFAATSTFVHQEQHGRMETYTEQQSYPCGTTSSSSGSRFGSTSTTRYCTRPVTRTRWVTDVRTVVDGRCGQEGTLIPSVGAEYVLQYDFYGNQQCSLRCYRQLTQPDGTFQLVPCGAPSGRP